MSVSVGLIKVAKSCYIANIHRKKFLMEIEKSIQVAMNEPFTVLKENHSEHELQRACVSWARWHFSEWAVVFAVPNQRYGKAAGGRMKAEGVLAGVADLCIMLENGRVAFIELKKPGGRLSTSQKQFEASCGLLGHSYQVVDNQRAFRDAFVGLLRKKVKNNWPNA